MKNHEASLSPCILKEVLSGIKTFQTGTSSTWLESFCQAWHSHSSCTPVSVCKRRCVRELQAYSPFVGLSVPFILKSVTFAAV